MMTDEEAIEQLTDIYKLTAPIVYKKKRKKSRDRLLKLIKKIKNDGLESVTKEE